MVQRHGRFRPQPGFGGIFNLTSEGNRDVFVQKLNTSGNFLWAKAFGGISGDGGNTIAVDASGNVYTVRYFAETVDFDPGLGIFNLTSVGEEDCFIQKLDASGIFLWAKAFGGDDTEKIFSITLDASGNVYTTGHFQGTVDFDPGPGLEVHLTLLLKDIMILLFKS